MNCDIAIITIREDEYKAVLDRLPGRKIFKGDNRTYTVGKLRNRNGGEYSVAVIRTPEQGQNAAQDTARDAIEDLDPHWVMVVGIAGAMPDREFTLGDVVVGARLHDFTVGAQVEGAGPEFTNQGGPMTKEVQDLISLIPAIEESFGGWETESVIGMPRPRIALSDKKFYGNEGWKTRTKTALEHNFMAKGHRTTPIVTTRAIASSGFLIKDTKLIESWRKSARDLAAVEMELAGVYAAAQRRHKEYPVIAVRGISDIVGFKRDADWTLYACKTAASFCISMLQNLPTHFLSAPSRAESGGVVSSIESLPIISKLLPSRGASSKRTNISPRQNSIELQVVTGDVREIEADVLVLKYAQSLYGADKLVYDLLINSGKRVSLPKIDEFTFNYSHGPLGTENVLFVGVAPLRDFNYTEIRNFARNALVYLAREAPDVRHVALTLHGPGFGLDESEAFESELAGLVDAFTTRDYPEKLNKVSFVEKSSGRAKRLADLLFQLLPRGRYSAAAQVSADWIEDESQAKLRNAGYSSAGKPHVFVAMPFAADMDDIFHYGIQTAVNAAGLLCERADLSTFTGNILDWVKLRIDTAKLVIADLTASNPNVYLEVGYAWGRGVPTVLVIKGESDLKFDVQSQRCLRYKTIQDLEKSLTKELNQLALS
jgi:nucleoside phosphorylase